MSRRSGTQHSTTAAAQAVETLLAHGVDRIYSVAGESYLALLDALYDRPEVDVVTCRHEGSAGLAALADAKLTGRVGVCVVNRAPGAANAALPVYAASADAVPLVLLVGQARMNTLDGPAFQELDAPAMFGGLAKGIWTVHTPCRVAELFARAIRVAESGTPGPTVLVLPEDVLPAPANDAIPGRFARPAMRPDPAAVAPIAKVLAGARRPLLIAGSRLESRAGRALLVEVAAKHRIAVACTAKRQSLYPNTDPHYAGHLHLGTPASQRSALAGADAILAVGTRLDAVTTGGYTLPTAPIPAQPLVHVYPDPAVLGMVYQPTVALTADPVAVLEALAGVDPPAPELPDERAGWVSELHQREVDAATWVEEVAEDGVIFGMVAAALDRLTDSTAVVTVDAGSFTGWLHRYYRFTGDRRLLGIAPGAMGFGVPAGLAAALRLGGERQVVAVVGDGGLQMTGAELATAVARRARLCVVVADNGSYGSIRQHQERTYPGRVIGTDLANPDFGAWAAAYGALALSVTDNSEVEPALERALAHDGPSVVVVRSSLRHLGPADRGRTAGQEEPVDNEETFT